MNPMTPMLAQQRINDLHRTASRVRVARQARTRRWGRRAQLAGVTA
jgi:hypothetical protein